MKIVSPTPVTTVGELRAFDKKAVEQIKQQHKGKYNLERKNYDYLKRPEVRTVDV